MARDPVPHLEDALVAAMVTIEVIALRTGRGDWTWSHWLRRRLHVDCRCRVGRAGFAVGWPCFACWLLCHLMRWRLRRHAAHDWPV